MTRLLSSPWTKRVLFLLGLAPFGTLFVLALQRELGANPIEYITHATGDWCIRLLMATLAVTPLRYIFNQPLLTKYRRMIGLYSFFYAALHFMVWFGLDQGFDFQGMFEDIVKRKFITVGMLGLLILIALAITSTKGWVKRLGWKRWQKLHKLVYVVGIAAIAHYYWLVKSDVRAPLRYAGIFAVLMGYRVFRAAKDSKAKPVSGRS